MMSHFEISPFFKIISSVTLYYSKIFLFFLLEYFIGRFKTSVVSGSIFIFFKLFFLSKSNKCFVYLEVSNFVLAITVSSHLPRER